MFTTLVVEDEVDARKKLVAWLREEPDIELIADVGDFEQARTVLANQSITLAFLDIQIGGGSGLDLALLLPSGASVVFVTAYDGHAARAFDLNAVDYLLKPYTHERLGQALARIRTRTTTNRPSDRAESIATGTPGAKSSLLLRAGNRFVSVRLDEIAWVEADDNYLKLHGARTFHERLTMAEFIDRYPMFLRIHRSYAVNVALVEEVWRPVGSDPVLRVSGGKELRVGRSFVSDVTARLPRIR
jgi:two-component system LytT family response regulator